MASNPEDNGDFSEETAIDDEANTRQPEEIMTAGDTDATTVRHGRSNDGDSVKLNDSQSRPERGSPSGSSPKGFCEPLVLLQKDGTIPASDGEDLQVSEPAAGLSASKATHGSEIPFEQGAEDNDKSENLELPSHDIIQHESAQHLKDTAGPPLPDLDDYLDNVPKSNDMSDGLKSPSSLPPAPQPPPSAPKTGVPPHFDVSGLTGWQLERRPAARGPKTSNATTFGMICRFPRYNHIHVQPPKTSVFPPKHLSQDDIGQNQDRHEQDQGWRELGQHQLEFDRRQGSIESRQISLDYRQRVFDEDQRELDQHKHDRQSRLDHRQRVFDQDQRELDQDHHDQEQRRENQNQRQHVLNQFGDDLKDFEALLNKREAQINQQADRLPAQHDQRNVEQREFRFRFQFGSPRHNHKVGNTFLQRRQAKNPAPDRLPRAPTWAHAATRNNTLMGILDATGSERSSSGIFTPSTSTGSERSSFGIFTPSTSTGSERSSFGIFTPSTSTGSERSSFGIFTPSTSTGSERSSFGIFTPSTSTGSEPGSSVIFTPSMPTTSSRSTSTLGLGNARRFFRYPPPSLGDDGPPNVGEIPRKHAGDGLIPEQSHESAADWQCSNDRMTIMNHGWFYGNPIYYVRRPDMKEEDYDVVERWKVLKEDKKLVEAYQKNWRLARNKACGGFGYSGGKMSQVQK